jgi:tRNA-(ms[2]io[6]A)-hydroxylase
MHSKCAFGESSLQSSNFEFERLPLVQPSSRAWLDTVISDIDAFLIDHAACERKVSALCMSFAVKYRDKPELVERMGEMAVEELHHFNLVTALLHRRGLQQGSDEKDEYIKQLLQLCRTDVEGRLMDRLIVSGIVEARGCERFAMVAQAFGEGTELGDFYDRLSRAEAKHQLFFIQMALRYFDRESVSLRLSELLQLESQILSQLRLRPGLY